MARLSTAAGERAQTARRVFRDFLGRKTGYAWAVYPTGFGISVWQTDNPLCEKQIKHFKDLLDKHGIIYAEDLSPKGHVLRFSISKSQKNLERIMKLTARYKEK